MLLTEKYQRVDPFSSTRFLETAAAASTAALKPYSSDHYRGDHCKLTTGWGTSRIEQPGEPRPSDLQLPDLHHPDLQPAPKTHPHAIDPLYLFACHLAWEQQEEPSAAWELLAAARCSHADTRAHARSLLASSRHLRPSRGSGCTTKRKQPAAMEDEMNAPYGLDIIDNCSDCTQLNSSFFCGFSSEAALRSLSDISHKSVLPAGAILFVEGQRPRGIFILCSGKVNLSATSRDGKILILKTAEAGEALGMSAVISGMGYELTAETATPCQVNFVERNHFLELMQAQSEVGMQTAQCLSRDFRCAHRDIHDLVLTRSSAGKLARLLLSNSPTLGVAAAETRITVMTHEEMAQRIGASRETVTRLLGGLRKKRLIRLDGPTLVIRNRNGLEALAG